jgi:hypothetical protein
MAQTIASSVQVDEYVRKQAGVRVPVPRTLRYAVNGIGRRTHRLR